MMDYTKFSKNYTVRRLTEADIPEILALCAENKRFYEYCPPFVTQDSIRNDMNALPPRKTAADKYYLGYFESTRRLIAILDFIDHYPDEKTAFIGFYMVERAEQGKGIGSAIVTELFDYLADLGYQNVRLGYVDGNKQSERFWKNNQFADTGLRNHDEHYDVIVMNRTLQQIQK